MSNKQQRKAKIKAKQRTMQDAKVYGQADLRQTEGLAKALEDKTNDDPKQAKIAADAALERSKEGKEELDPRLERLFKDFKLYKVIVIAFVVVGFAMVLLAMYLYSTGTIDGETQDNIIILANVVIVAGLAVAFGRARPIREDITAWNKVNSIALKESHGAHGATQADIDKIFLARARNKHVPPTPEYKRIRHLWIALLVVAIILMAVAVFMAQGNMNDVTIPVILIIVAFAVLLVTVVIDRVKMKPMREAYIKELDEKVKQASKASKKAHSRKKK